MFLREKKLSKHKEWGSANNSRAGGKEGEQPRFWILESFDDPDPSCGLSKTIEKNAGV